VLGAVGEAVAFLEAFINEMFQDAKDATDGVVGATAVQGLPPDLVRLMAAYWNSTRDGERVRTTAKYDASRVFAGCPRSDSSRLPHQDLDRFVFDDGRHVDLGELKGNIGSSNYPVPADVDLAGLRSVTIWCNRFSVSFAAAALS
jgi:hypothetical protein